MPSSVISLSPKIRVVTWDNTSRPERQLVPSSPNFLFSRSSEPMPFKFSLTFSNLVTCPSKKIIEKFSKKIFFIPNSPKLKINKIIKSKKNIILMLIPKIDNGINFKVIMDSIEILKNKKKILSF